MAYGDDWIWVNCNYKSSCKSFGPKCNNCKKNKSKKRDDFYEPITKPYEVADTDRSIWVSEKPYTVTLCENSNNSRTTRCC